VLRCVVRSPKGECRRTGRWFVFALGGDAGIRDRVEEQFTAEETA
jgi:hypothetical protein